MFFKYAFVLFCALSLQACQHLKPHQPAEEPVVVEVIEQPQPVKMDNAQIMSNQNVIVYPVTGDMSNTREGFPEYRGIVENTTMGGYTVFDSSVTVFAVEGTTHRPEYLPRYAVPQHVEQHYKMPESYGGTTSVLTPLSGSNLKQNYEPLSITNAGRRSKPILTAYE